MVTESVLQREKGQESKNDFGVCNFCDWKDSSTLRLAVGYKWKTGVGINGANYNLGILAVWEACLKLP